MAPGASPERRAGFDEAERRALIEIAARALRSGLVVPGPELDLETLPPRLAEPGASFVTLSHRGELRGCMGKLEASRPLAEDVALNARAAAFFDPRFPPVAPEELEELEIEISVLSPAEPVPAASEAELLAALRPGIDGVVLEEGSRRATFLPAVWKMLPEPADFLAQLRRKAGLPPTYWSPRLRFSRYTVESVDAPAIA